jgi:membrane-associated protease RseP (regulator of RpoE activity)
MANSTRNRGGKPADPNPAPPPAAAPEPAPAPKGRSPWTTVAIVVGALAVLALVCGGGIATGFGLSGGLAQLAALRAAIPFAYGRGEWMMPYGQQMMPYGQYMMPYGEHMMPHGPYGYRGTPFDEELPQDGLPRLAAAAYLGVTYEAVDPDRAEQEGLAAGEGALISTVIEGSPAAQAGLRAEDIILEVDGQRLVRAAMLRRLILAHAPDDVVRLVILRDGREQSLNVTLGAAPDVQTP